jgi:hypothetical protein
MNGTGPERGYDAKLVHPFVECVNGLFRLEAESHENTLNRVIPERYEMRGRNTTVANAPFERFD